MALGRTLVALDSRRTLGPGAIAACVLGSLVPDVDAVFMPIGWDIYLRRHQGGTHSLIGSIACAALTAAAVRLSSKGSHYFPLLLAAWAGAAGHTSLDVISGADVRFFWPVGPPVALPLFAMADPWLGGVLVLGLVALVLRNGAFRANRGHHPHRRDGSRGRQGCTLSQGRSDVITHQMAACNSGGPRPNGVR